MTDVVSTNRCCFYHWIDLKKKIMARINKTKEKEKVWNVCIVELVWYNYKLIYYCVVTKERQRAL